MNDEKENKPNANNINHENDGYEYEDVEEEIDDPDDKNEEETENDSSTSHSHSSDGRHRRHSRKKRRIKIKKRVRVKKKTSSKRKYKKFFETLIWIILIGGFITALVVLFNTLEINDSKYKGGKKTMNEPVKHQNLNETYQLACKQNSTLNVSCI